jgi:hypothetical protein
MDLGFFIEGLPNPPAVIKDGSKPSNVKRALMDTLILSIQTLDTILGSFL